VALAIPFGLAIGIALGMLGGGGSVLAVPVLVYVLGQSVHEATTASLVVVTAAAVAGGLGHARGRARQSSPSTATWPSGSSDRRTTPTWPTSPSASQSTRRRLAIQALRTATITSPEAAER
jgi:hypothetical protein